MTSPYSKVLRQSRQILTVASSPYVLCCFDFEIRTPDIKLETENVNIFAATMTPVVYFCRSHRYRCSLKVAIQRSFARDLMNEGWENIVTCRGQGTMRPEARF